MEQHTTSTQPVAVGTSLESLFLLHYLQSLTTLQNILVNPAYPDNETRFTAFNLQSIYILHLIPDATKRNEIIEAIDKIESEQIINGKFKNKKDNLYFARMLVVSEIVKYLQNSLDLIHSDILGAIAGDVDVISLEGDGFDAT